MTFDVFFTDCEGSECFCSFDSGEQALGFAQLCHELGDTNIRIEIREAAYVWKQQKRRSVSCGRR